MYRIIGGDGREYGPVAAAQVEQWIAQGRANGRTRIKPEDATDWSTLADLPEFAGPLAARSAPPPLPGGAPVPPAASPSETATAESAAAALPSTPAIAQSTPRDPVEAARTRVGRDYRFSVFECLSRAWDIMAGRFWLTVGATFVVGLVNGAASNIPFASLFLAQVFAAGLYWLLLRVARGEPAEFSDAFAGFTRALGHLIILSLVTILSLLFLALIAVGPLLWVLVQSGVFHGGKPEFAQLALPLFFLPVLMIPLLYFSVSWIFAPILVIDRGLGFWEAMELSRRVVGKRWFRLFFLHLAFVPLMIAGLLCFIVGIFVVSALMHTAIVVAYETAFRDEPGNASAGNRPLGTSDLHG